MPIRRQPYLIEDFFMFLFKTIAVCFFCYKLLQRQYISHIVFSYYSFFLPNSLIRNFFFVPIFAHSLPIEGTICKFFRLKIWPCQKFFVPLQAKYLTIRHGKGFSRSNLTYMRKLFLTFPKCELCLTN